MKRDSGWFGPGYVRRKVKGEFGRKQQRGIDAEIYLVHVKSAKPFIPVGGGVSRDELDRLMREFLEGGGEVMQVGMKIQRRDRARKRDAGGE